MNPDKKKPEVEEWLEEALNRYAQGEPRAGLETRVLANLRAEADRRATQKRSWWAVGGVGLAAAMLVIAVWIGVGRTKRSPLPIAQTPDAKHETAATTLEPRIPLVSRGPTRSVYRPVRDRKMTVQAKTAEPKLHRFPTPMPLTEQERMLVRYVREFPERAVQTAQIQTELRKQMQMEITGQPIPSSNVTDQPN